MTDNPPNPEETSVIDASRIGVLDVLRGIALLGMFLVHFNDQTSGGGALAGFYQKVVRVFFEERFWTMFGILFGVSFAIQFRRAGARAEPYIARYLRRMAALAVIGFIGYSVFGFKILLGYALWGIPLILFRNWSTRALIAAVVVSAASGSIYLIARASYGVATRGEQGYRAERDAIAAKDDAFRKANNAEQQSTEYSTVFQARLRHIPWFYSQWYTFLPVNTLTLFLLGLLGLRLGIFDRPEEHRRLIIGLMLFGAGSWAIAYLLSKSAPANVGPPLLELANGRLRNGFGVIRTMWLAFTYIGAVLLLVAYNPRWLERFGAFAYAGRMALTNYMIQIAILDLTFSNYALGLKISPLVGLAAAIALFLINAALSKWWLSRFRYGPLEWLWRSITYWHRQPLRGAPI